jgi:hypothetical protein
VTGTGGTHDQEENRIAEPRNQQRLGVSGRRKPFRLPRNHPGIGCRPGSST